MLPAGVAQAEESTASSPATADEALVTPDNETPQECTGDSSGLESADDNSDCIAENAPKADDQNVDEPTIDGPVSDELVDETQPEREPVEAQQTETTNRAEENGTKEEVAGTLEPQANAVYAAVEVAAVDAETGTYRFMTAPLR